MARAIIILILILVLARAFWQLMDGIIEGASGRVGPSGARRSVPMARDPVCGTFVVPARALTGGTGADMKYFCSEDCRRTYEMKLAP